MKCQVGSHQYACHVEWIVNVKVAHMLARQPPGASVILSAHAKDLSCVRLPAVWGRFFGCSLRMTGWRGRQPPDASVILSAHAKDLSRVRLPAVWGRFFGCGLRMTHWRGRQPPDASVILSAHAKDLSCVRLPAVWGRFFGCSLSAPTRIKCQVGSLPAPCHPEAAAEGSPCVRLYPAGGDASLRLGMTTSGGACRTTVQDTSRWSEHSE